MMARLGWKLVAMAYAGLTLAALCTPCAHAAESDAPAKYELRLIHLFDGKEPEYIFAIGDSGFRTVESLKSFLATLPAGSEIRWAPGCERFDDEPLLSSEKDMEAFKAFLKQKRISFVLVPSG